MFSEILKNALIEKRITIETLHEQTNIPLNHLVSLERGDFSKLPALVFTRGYLKKISHHLELEFDNLWKEFVIEFDNSQISKTDLLPQSHFQNKRNLQSTFPKIIKIIPITIIIVAIGGFMLFQAKSLLGPPKLKLDYPALDLVTKDSAIKIEGRGPANSYITINGKEIYLSENGNFSEQIDLNPGLNEIVVQAKNKLNKTTTITRQIFKDQEN